MRETIQFKILVGIKAMIAEGTWNINPFFGASKEEVERDFEGAKEVYKNVFPLFVSSYVISNAIRARVITDGSLESLQKGKGEVIDAIKGRKIPEMPFYRELCELRI